MGLLVLNVDHLPTYLLGPYGNTSVPTPTLNRWAANGIVVDSAFKSGSRNHALITSTAGPSTHTEHVALSSHLDLRLTPQQKGHSNWQPSADPSHPASIAHLATVSIPTRAAPKVARDWESTAMADYLEQAIDHLAAFSLNTHHRIWLDLPLFSGHWDAPLEWRSFLANDDASEIYSGWQAPHLPRHGDGISGFDELHGFDPDQRLAYEHAAGAMVMLLDHACEWLEACLAKLTPGHEWAILLTAESGYGLGEHFGIGHLPDSLWAEETHVPVLLHTQLPNQFPARVAGVQNQQQVLDFWLSDFGPENPSPDHPSSAVAYDSLVTRSLLHFDSLNYSIFSADNRHIVLSFSTEAVSCRTVTWSFLWIVGQAPKLFVRPDDRAEQNDVATRCRDVVAAFQWFLPDVAHALGHNPTDLPPLQNGDWLKACETLAADGLVPVELTWEEHAQNLKDQRFTALERLPLTLWESRH